MDDTHKIKAKSTLMQGYFDTMLAVSASSLDEHKLQVIEVLVNDSRIYVPINQISVIVHKKNEQNGICEVNGDTIKLVNIKSVVNDLYPNNLGFSSVPDKFIVKISNSKLGFPCQAVFSAKLLNSKDIKSFNLKGAGNKWLIGAYIDMQPIIDVSAFNSDILKKSC